MDDKKKMMILGAMFVVMLGIGAFQFMKPSDPVPATTNKVEKGSESTETKVASLPNGENGELAAPDFDPALVAVNQLETRNPFDGRKWTNDAVQGLAKPETNVSQPQQPVHTPSGSNNGVRRPRGSYPQIPPMGLDGNGFGVEGQLPAADPNGSVANGGPTGSIQPGGKLPNFDDVPYEVSGVVNGKRQAAIFKDAAGNQRLVRVGDKLDDDTQVISVSKGKVVVKSRGKTKVLKVEYGQGDKGAPNEPRQ